MKLKINLILILSLVSTLLHANNNFKMRGDIDGIDDLDFYRIYLDEQIISEMREDFYDIRIKNDSGIVVPFILKVSENASIKLNAPITGKTVENNESIYTFTFNTEKFISKVKIDYGKNAFFLRNATIQRFTGKDSIWYTIKNIELNSNNDGIFSIPLVKTTALRIIIHNGDNPPLKLLNFSFYHPEVSLTCKLTDKHSYSVLWGNKTIERPEYDLVHFEEQLPKDIRVVEIVNIEENPDKKVVNTNREKEETTIWIILAIAIVVMAAITFVVLRKFK